VLQRHCAEATDIVAQLHRAAQELTLLRDDWVESSRAGEAATAAVGQRVDESGQSRGEPVFSANPVVPPDLTASPAGPVAMPSASVPPVSAAPWSAPSQGSPAWQSGGSVPVLPDFGGALVGLVAQIAQSLGSYADASGPGAAANVAETPRLRADSHSPLRRKPPPAEAGVPAVPAVTAPKSAVAKSPVPQPVPAIAGPPAPAPPAPAPPPPELLAAERPPDPAPPVVATPQPEPPPASAPPPPAPAPLPPPAPAKAPAAEVKTPCEIAAGALPKVGE
jgi:hypothetical protein